MCLIDCLWLANRLAYRFWQGVDTSLVSQFNFFWYNRKVNFDGLSAHFLFVVLDMDLHAQLEATLAGMGYELVDLEVSGRKQKLMRVFIDKLDGVNIDDCVLVSDHLGRWFAVEGIDYDRLEVSSPGMDRPLKKASDFVRFGGEQAQIRIRVPVGGQRNYVGVLRGVKDGWVQLEVEGVLVGLELSNIDKARLVPKF